MIKVTVTIDAEHFWKAPETAGIVRRQRLIIQEEGTLRHLFLGTMLDRDLQEAVALLTAGKHTHTKERTK